MTRLARWLLQALCALDGHHSRTTNTVIRQDGPLTRTRHTTTCDRCGRRLRPDG